MFDFRTKEDGGVLDAVSHAHLHTEDEILHSALFCHLKRYIMQARVVAGKDKGSKDDRM